MLAIDSNMLVYAHRADSKWHETAYGCVKSLAEGMKPWLIPWPCIHEFLAIVTHPRIYSPPTPLEAAVKQVRYWLESPSLEVGHESDSYLDTLELILNKSQVVGPQIHDARIVAICVEHSVDVLWTADRDFSRFSGLKVVNPLIKI